MGILCNCCSKSNNQYRELDTMGKKVFALVGDSITYGSGDANSYPDKFKQLLNNDSIVHNFGLNSRTMRKKGDNPYWNEEAYK